MDGVVAAARTGDVAKLKRWTETGGAVDGLLDEACARWAPLHFSAAEGHLVAIQSLVEAGADVNLKTVGDGYSALHLSARFGHGSVAEYLLRSGGSVDALDGYGHSALHYAAAFGHGGVVSVLLEHGADGAIRDGSGNSASQVARQAGHEAVAAAIEAATANRPAKARLRAWLTAIGLEPLFNAFLTQGFDDVDFVANTGLEDTDLDAIGVSLAGHRKKLKALYRIQEFTAANEGKAQGGGGGGEEEEGSVEEGSGDDEEDGSGDEEEDEDEEGSGSGSDDDEE